jgi:ubiquinone/menaquinone biosynthesis C-methylase UbiE
MGHEGVSWLERPERTKEEGTDQLLDALDIKPTDVVADFGAGSGYFSFRIAARATKGAVLAVDIQPEMLAAIEEKKQQHHVPTLRTILGTEKDPGLPQDSVDLVLLVDVYHELRYPLETMQAIARSLKPTGRVALVEYRGEDPSIPIKPLHKMTEAQVRKEMKLAGLTWLGTVNTLPQQHLIFFGKGEARRP